MLSPFEEEELPGYGLGITNLVMRATAAASELGPEEYRRGATALRRKVVRFEPRTIAFLVPAWNDALLFVEREGLKETHQLGVWLSLYGVPETTAAPLRQGLTDLESSLSVAKTDGASL